MGKEPHSTKPRPARSADWELLHRRLEAARQGVAREVTPDGERAILRKRAETLAEQPSYTEEGKVRVEVLEFLLAGETYAVEVSWVAETCPLRDLTPLPGTPPFVAGIINVRGRIVSVLDIRQFFDLPRQGLTDLNKVIIVSDGAMEFGILADGIIGTRSIALADLQAPLPTMTGIREEYLKGLTSQRTALLDAKRLLGDKNIIVHEEI
jgi:purine-binding chemotaxis protein CheW